MKLYRIYTEDNDNLSMLTSQYFEGFTTYNTVGYWKGIKENSVVIEFVTNDEYKVKRLVGKIKVENKQETMLVIAQEVEAQFI